MAIGVARPIIDLVVVVFVVVFQPEIKRLRHLVKLVAEELELVGQAKVLCEIHLIVVAVRVHGCRIYLLSAFRDSWQ
jgi:hypothetical protein